MNPNQKNVPKGYFARSVKPARAPITLPEGRFNQPSYEAIEQLQCEIDRLRGEKFAIEQQNYSLSRALSDLRSRLSAA